MTPQEDDELIAALQADIAGALAIHPKRVRAFLSIGQVQALLARLTAMREKIERKGETVEQIITAWAYAHNIDGAARNDLFKRLSALTTNHKGDAS
jgi:hypothetical protein